MASLFLFGSRVPAAPRPPLGPAPARRGAAAGAAGGAGRGAAGTGRAQGAGGGTSGAAGGWGLRWVVGVGGWEEVDDG